MGGGKGGGGEGVEVERKGGNCGVVGVEGEVGVERSGN